jgi:hypothetical protein
MDPTSITSTLIDVLKLTSSVTSKCYDYRQGSASSSASKLIESLNSLKAVGESLLRLVDTSGSDGASQFAAVKLLAKDNGTLVHCEAALKKLDEALELGDGVNKTGKGLEWPLSKDKMNKNLEDLEGFIGTMKLALTADQA